MISKHLLTALCAAVVSLSASAQEAKPDFKWYGFIRNYAVWDSHASDAGNEDLYYYMPKDNDASGAFNFVALTSRLGVDIKGYQADGFKIDAKIEADFYNKNSTTAILRLRQAFVTIARGDVSWKVGQGWHPMAADMPDIYSLETGAPFGPFSRTPLASLDYKLTDGLSLTAAAIWQMQYTSTGPNGGTADYIKRSGIPEAYLGLSCKSGNFLARVGGDVLAIKPYADKDGLSTTWNAFAYAQYVNDSWSVKNKLTYANDGSHFNMIGGYGVTDENKDGVSFAATRNVSDWFSVLYKGWGRWRPCLFLGYTRMMGAPEIVDHNSFYGKLNADKVGQIYRIQPEITYNIGKLALGMEYMMTSVQYGNADNYMRVVNDLHWVSNHRIQGIVRYNF